MEQNLSIISSLEDTVLTKDYVSSSYSKIGKFSNSFCLILAIISIILGIYFQNNYVNYALLWGVVIGIILFILFFVTKKQTIVVTAHSSQKIIQTINDKEKAKKFIEDIIEAKAKV